MEIIYKQSEYTYIYDIHRVSETRETRMEKNKETKKYEC